MANKVENGSKVKVHYTGTLEGGEVFDSSEGREPLEFEIGTQQVIPGFEKGLVGMELNQEKEIRIPAAEAYGERNDMMVQKVPREMLPPNLKDAKKGMVLRFNAPNGMPMQAMISDVNDKELTLDLNHPLAGKTLIFKVKVIEIN